MKLSTAIVLFTSLIAGVSASCRGECKQQCGGGGPQCNWECIHRCMGSRCPEADRRYLCP
ncbi:hypothetical protein VTJ04DRAFT_5352 [Mycothermus thermophilus]|uniref:uncharacterized protein n=1 Tax=Humicola insolens TaxID=85995 RepID=UPI003743C35B